MTVRYNHPAMYTCDGCGNETVGSMDRLPTAWVQRVEDEKPSLNGIDYAGAFIAHYCPACQAKRTQEPAK